MNGTEQLIHLVYVSEATVAFERIDLLRLLAKARPNNDARGITGVLLYVDGFFLQLLEGNRGDVLSLYEKIKGDHRHRRVSKLITEPIEKREFENWSMGYAEVGRTDLATIPGLNDFFASGSCFDELDAGRATALLMAFREGRWRRHIGA